MPRVLAPNIMFLPARKSNVLRPGRSAVMWGMEQLNQVVEKSGYGGIELHDGRFNHTLQLRRAGQERAQTLARGVFRLHESFVGVADPVPANKNQARQTRSGSLVENLGMKALLPTGPASLNHLAALEEKLRRLHRMPYVLFPDEHGDVNADRRKALQFSNGAIQPTADVAAAWGVGSPEDFIEEVVSRNYQVVWDHFHGDREGKTSKGRMRQDEYLPVLLEQEVVAGVHIGLYRSDFEEVDPRRSNLSAIEGNALLSHSGIEKGPLGDLFAMLGKHNWQGDVTIEAAPAGMAEAWGSVTLEEMQRRHSDIVTAVKDNLPHIEWESFPKVAPV